MTVTTPTSLDDIDLTDASVWERAAPHAWLDRLRSEDPIGERVWRPDGLSGHSCGAARSHTDASVRSMSSRLVGVVTVMCGSCWTRVWRSARGR
jgi:hypothetical protein